MYKEVYYLHTIVPALFIVVKSLQHFWMFTTQTAALPQSLAVTTRDTCLCQLSVPGHAPPSPHVTPHTRDRAKLSQAETQIISPEIMPSPLSLGFTFIHGSTIISCISVTDHFHLLSNIFYILFLLTELPPPKCRPAKVHAGTWPRQLFARIQSQRGQGREVQSKSKIDESIFVLFFVWMYLWVFNFNIMVIDYFNWTALLPVITCLIKIATIFRPEPGIICHFVN